MLETLMAGANLLALLDDITTVLGDVTILSKVAAKKKPPGCLVMIWP
jgi:predicted DNA repair protein MutK